MPSNKPELVITILGPNLSDNLAVKMHINPNTRSLVEEAPEVKALVHPKVSMRDSKKTPKAAKVPHIKIIITNTAATMI